MLHPGLYEQVINNALTSELSGIPDARKSIAPIDKAEAAKVLAQYLADVVQKGMENVLDNGGDISAQIALANQIVTLIQNTTQEADFATLGVDQRAEQLLALLREQDPRLAAGKTAADLSRPETSIAQSSLFTGAINEPQMYTELKKEILSADRIDMLVSFIKWSGLRLLMDELREFTQNGGELRIITTSYMGATDVKAIEELRVLPNTRIKVSYDTKRTRLHAKTYVFYNERTPKEVDPMSFLQEYRNRPRRVVFYGRVSTEHEAQVSALDNQMDWYQELATKNPNWEVVGQYVDEGITGTQATKRPAFMQMIEDAESGKFDLVVTREVCRFARNTVDTLSYTRKLSKLGVEVYFASDNIWTMDNDGELRLTIMATMAQEESRKISERVRAGIQMSREKGTLYGNGNILGYDLDKIHKTYIINEEQAETVRMIFEQYATGDGLGKVAKALIAKGRKDGGGRLKWDSSKITRILRNPTYMGYCVYNRSASGCHGPSAAAGTSCRFGPVLFGAGCPGH